MYLNNNVTRKVPKEKTEPTKRSKAPIYIACLIVSLLSIGVVVWVIISYLNEPPVNEDYFISNSTKTTINLTPTDSTSGSSHRQTHVVYEYKDDLVVSMKTYFEYEDARSAEIAYETLKNQLEFKDSELVDKYIIVTADASQFEGLTASDIRQQAAAIEAYQKKNSGEENTQTEANQTESDLDPSGSDSEENE
jgi:hypothetical protein